MKIRQYTGGWKRDNIRSICKELSLGHKPKPRVIGGRSRITRRGRVLENGDILWRDCVTGQLSIEKKGN